MFEKFYGHSTKNRTMPKKKKLLGIKYKLLFFLFGNSADNKADKNLNGADSKRYKKQIFAELLGVCIVRKGSTESDHYCTQHYCAEGPD